MINHPVQAGAATVFKTACVRLDRLYPKYGRAHHPAARRRRVRGAIGRLRRGRRGDAAGDGRGRGRVVPELRPRVQVNIAEPGCWNKDGHADSIDRWAADRRSRCNRSVVVVRPATPTKRVSPPKCRKPRAAGLRHRSDRGIGGRERVVRPLPSMSDGTTATSRPWSSVWTRWPPPPPVPGPACSRSRANGCTGSCRRSGFTRPGSGSGSGWSGVLDRSSTRPPTEPAPSAPSRVTE